MNIYYCYNLFNYITNVIHIMSYVSYANDIGCNINDHWNFGPLDCHDVRCDIIQGLVSSVPWGWNSLGYSTTNPTMHES